jgi:hypothetical protein
MRPFLRNVKPPEVPPAPVPAAPVKGNPAVGRPGAIGANPAPGLANPPMPPDVHVMAANDGQTVDLRGLAMQVGFKFREVWRIQCQRTDKFTNSRGQAVPVTGSIVGDFENLYTVEDAVNDTVIKYQTRVIKTEHTYSYVDPSGKKRRVDRIDDLAGEVVVSDSFRKTWRHALLEADPSSGQQKARARLRSPFEERDHLPAGKQKQATSWEVDAIQLKKLFGSGVDAVSGKLKATFARLDEYQRDKCAVIEYNGTIRVRSEPEEVLQERMETWDVGLESYRSLKHAIGIKTTGVIVIRTMGNIQVDNRDAEFVGGGRMLVTYEATVEK